MEFACKVAGSKLGVVLGHTKCGAGKNLGVNIFDQNRIHANIGYKINNHVNIELGYINQTLQQGKLVSTKTIMQRNSGFILATILNF